MTSGNCEIYVSTDNEQFYKLDLFKDEKITLKFIKKDSQDLSKVFAPFSQGFSVPATPKNLQIFNHFGDVNLVRSFNSATFKCKIYLHGILNKVGELKIENLKYKNQKIETINVAFNSNLVSLKDTIGNDTLDTLSEQTIRWLPSDSYSTIRNATTLGELTYYTPLVSRYRVWNYSAEETTVNDNIHYKVGNSATGNRIIRTDELRPAVSVKSLFNLIKNKYNLNINLPLENRPEFANAYLWCNGENFKPETTKLILKKNYSQGGYNNNYRAVVNLTDSSIDVTKGVNARYIKYSLNFNGVLLLDNKPTASARIILVDKTTGERIGEQEFNFQNGNNNPVDVDIFYPSPRTASTFSFFTFIECDTPVMWGNNRSNLRFTIGTNIVGTLANGSYTANVSSNETGLHYIKLLSALPETKISDFLASIFKTFNISIFESSDGSGALDFLTPTDLNNQSQIFAQSVKDYTAYVTKRDFDKKIISEVNYYNLKHKQPNYKSNIDFFNQFGKEYGQAMFPEVKPEKAKEYVIETNFSIIPPVSVNGLPSLITAYGFTNSFTNEGGLFRYEPNKEDLTLFYKQEPQGVNSLSCQNLNSSGVLINDNLSRYQPSSPLGDGGAASINYGFSILTYQSVNYERTLYIEYYEELVQRMLNVNTLEHSFELTLPTRELVSSQGVTIQPNGFRLQNEVIIQEQKYEISEMDIDLTTGQTKAKLLNK